MKHLLIIFSILLLSSFVTSCDKKEETIYRWETSSGIVWKRFGDKDTHRVYKGEWKNEKPNGLGVMTYPDGQKYVGRWKDDKRNGQGTFTYPDGGKYVGRWKDDKRNGQGTLTYPNGREYEGVFKSGERNGQGTLIFPDGIKFVGEFREDKPWNTTGFDKDGNIFGKYVNGK